MAPRVCLLTIALVWLGPATSDAQDRERKRAAAVRVAEGAVRVDGRLDEAVWRQATQLAGFTQKEPVEGDPATDDLDVRFVYDNGALYVGARMTSSAPIQAPLGRRDDVEQAEHLLVSLDTYLDRRTASTFGVSASGARLDLYYASDNDFDDDDTFTPVWQAQTSVDERGWTAELRIPFSQLRFNERSPQIWGLNVRRWIPALNEEVFWSPIRRTDERWASLFGDLHGIDVQPRQRVELLPYVSSNARLIGNRDAADPFNDGVDAGGGVGGDAKLGIGSNLTLEATVNPDFGQVEADPAQVNLSAFEIFFDERRPFFVEGANLLVGNVEDYFYSRRIGAPPPGPVSSEFVDFPRTTTILGAAKLTGRLASGTSLGMLSAVTDEESARDLRQRRVRRRARGAAHVLWRGASRAADRPAGVERCADDHGRPPPARRQRPAGRLVDAQCVHAERRLGPALRRSTRCRGSQASPTQTASPAPCCVSSDPAPGSTSARTSPTSRWIRRAGSCRVRRAASRSSGRTRAIGYTKRRHRSRPPGSRPTTSAG